MLFWRGQGWIVGPLVFAVSLAAELVTETVTGDDTYYQNSGLAFPIALVIAGAICWKLGRSKNEGLPATQTLQDKETGEEVVLELKTHTCMFIRLEFWGPILWAIALWLALVYIPTR